ncbi:arylsulfatase B-like isoform X2 [Haemaphysalis longicornis]
MVTSSALGAVDNIGHRELKATSATSLFPIGCRRGRKLFAPSFVWSMIHLLALLAVMLSMTVYQRLNDRQPPNIIFILADDVGWDDVSFHGSKQIPTPNLDALAADGVILNNYYTQQQCTPSRSALMTGLYPIRTGTQHSVITPAEPWGLPLEHKLLSQYLKDLGYETHIVGKWHLGSVTKEHTPTYRGFDTFYGFYGAEEDYYNHTNRLDDRLGLDFWFNTEPLWNETGHYSTTLYTERARNLIRNRNKRKPFFLYLSHQAAHSGVDVQFAAPVDNIKKFHYIAEKERTIYAAMLDTLDESVGAVLLALQEEDMLDNSIVVFSSDNGGSSFGPHASRGYNWPLRGAKFALWEGGTRVPAFIWSPLLAKNRRTSKQLMHVTDWLPTLYRAGGGNVAKIGRHLDGIDMWRHLSLDLPSPRTEMLYNIDPIENTSAIRHENYKLLLGIYADGKFDGRFKTTGNPRAGNDFDDLMANSSVAHVLSWLPLWKRSCGATLRQQFRRRTYQQMRTATQKTSTEHGRHGCNDLSSSEKMGLVLPISTKAAWYPH